jgi:hypothetical protein
MGKYDVAAYVWPSYTGDELRTRIFWPEGIGEWQSVKNAVSKFPGHSWPRKPLWGYVNEADPKVMEMQIDEATGHGINIFIYDWYWYDKRPFLENCLNDGFLKAKNNKKMKFYLMWANHDADYLWDVRNSHIDNVIWDGAVDRKEFEIVCNRLLEKYFTHPLYYKINGKPVLSIFSIDRLVQGLGGIEKTAEALKWFNDLLVKAGMNGLHLQFILRWDTDPDTVKTLGFDSTTHYQFAMFTDIDRDYIDILDDVHSEWKKIDGSYDIPYFPSVSLGWDNNPRFKDFKPGIIRNNTPENVQKVLEMAKKYADNHPDQPPLVIINSWNEWTETSYLQPDDLYGYGYLESVKRVFRSSV